MTYPITLPKLEKNEPLVTIGLATYRRVEGVRIALRSLLDQSYRNIRIIIHENPSDEKGIEEAIYTEVAGDSRVTYRLNDTNVGAVENLHSLLVEANSPLFMWASDDDRWDADFVETLVDLHLRTPGIAMAAGGVRVATSEGEITGTCDGFTRFSVPRNHADRLTVFLEDPEILGKANCYYGLFRTEALREVWTILREKQGSLYGFDVVLIFSVLARYNAAFIDRPMLTKGTPKSKYRLRWYPFPSDYIFPVKEYHNYSSELRRMAPSKEIELLVDGVMKARRRRQILLSSWRKPLSNILRKIVYLVR